MSPEAAATWVKDRAQALDLDVAGIADATAPWPAAARLRQFVELGYHGDMAWMADTADRRAHPTALWSEARSAVVVAMSYAPDHDPLEDLARTENAAISVYARGADYHDVFKRRLKQLARAFAEDTGAAVKVFVDTAPLMEKPLAERAGLGWQGKHTNLVSRSHGSWLFLGAMLTTAEVSPDAPEADHCGSCRRCLDVCPTDAFPAAYQLDARRCLAYLSIEHAGPIPREYRAAMGNRVFGCDDCLAVCPWNKFAAQSQHLAFAARPATSHQRLVDYAALDEAGFRAVFAGSPIKRTGRERFVRNVAIALGNVREPAERVRALAAAERLLADESALVRGAAVWAVWRLAPRSRFAELLRDVAPHEHHETVQAEWAACAQTGCFTDVAQAG